jgi:hypothetical protein
LVWILAVREAQIGCGRLFAEDVFALHREIIKQRYGNEIKSGRQ